MAKQDRTLSDESGARFVECMNVLHKVHETFSREVGSTPTALFHAIRLYMVAATAYAARSGMKGTDEEMRAALHELLDAGINDYQFNER